LIAQLLTLFSPKILGQDSFIQDDDSNNPYNFLRVGIQSEGRSRLENLESDNLPEFGHKENEDLDQIDQLSDQKKMYPHDSIHFDKDSELNLEEPTSGIQIRTQKIDKLETISLVKKSDFDEDGKKSEVDEESPEKSQLDEESSEKSELDDVLEAGNEPEKSEKSEESDEKNKQSISKDIEMAPSQSFNNVEHNAQPRNNVENR
jgi:hypothetical protein